ncbi:lipopolysaccharide biosynthesis protein RfbH [Lysinibacillus sp. 1 U-2021]|uniref:lipopolysaccharide biosynthesis protein RfbH n=1 Tax=Lysinibacillus sp. 1 U-2021 TaxID=3039426 RepID=UPI0024810810|nr:lipopolysaccharide biosynthesis protein RfbH [Lysinibacillus sp. 1 U-2021]WGT40579.1 lipopolysaccharide biosynthesis protein RfbH [Lysinibacillus sp. 1 U-2021]
MIYKQKNVYKNSLNKYFAIIELNLKSVMAVECIKQDDGIKVVTSDFIEWTHDELNQLTFQEVGQINDAEYESVKRKAIFNKVAEFHDLFHRKQEFVAGESQLSYAGKIYNKDEMVALVDASLDFWLTSGRYCIEFEKKLAKYLGVRYTVLTNSGSSANLLAISALTSYKLGEKRLKRGDEVITVAASFPTTIAPIVQNGLIPVFLDVELGTYNIKVDLLEEAISEKTRAIMIAHTMGNPFDLEAIMALAEKYNLWVIEDNCDALGAKYAGKYTGTHGHIGTSSFYPPHHITMGEGGALYTNDPKLKVIIESFRDWGRDCWCPSGCDNTCNKRFDWQLGDLPDGYDHKYTYSHLGYNLKVTDMQAAIGVQQLEKLPNFITKRNNNFNLLKEKLKEIEDYVILPEATPNTNPSWFGFIMTIKDDVKVKRNEIVNHLESKGIQTRMLFAGNIMKQPAFKDIEYRVVGELENTDRIVNNTFLVGVYPGLTEEMIEYMALEIIQFFRGCEINE